MRRGIPLATASVVPSTWNPSRTNIAMVPTNAMVSSIRPAGSTGCASTAGAQPGVDAAAIRCPF